MDYIPWLQLHDCIHWAEEAKVPLPTGKTVAIVGAIGIPVAVLLHETSDIWYSKLKYMNVPVLSWFKRKWVDPEQKELHLRTARNVAIFGFICCVMNEKLPKITPMDYVSDRLSSSTARRHLTNEIINSRKAAFMAANDVMMQEGMDDAKARNQRDAALRRRHMKERQQ